MKVEIKVPAMGESITEATVGSILKASGSRVEMDEEVLELETEKVNQVLYSPQAGVVQWSVDVDDVVEIGQVIGHVDTEGAPTEEAPKQEKAEAPQQKPAMQQPPAASTGQARVMKEQFTQEIKQGKEAEQAAQQKPAPAPAPQPKPAQTPQKPSPKAAAEGRETRKRMSKIRRVIAQRLVEAQHETAMLTTFNEVDMTQVMRLRSEYKERFEKEHGIKLGFLSFFIKAAVSALQQIPDINAYIDGEEIVYRNYFDIGVAVSTDRGLVVPVVRDCDKLSFAQLEESIAGYAKKAREGTISVDDLQGGGFTITNGGVFGSLLSTPILNMPQSGILGMHKIQKRAVVVDDEIVIRPMMYVALSYDHRIVDGKEAVTFLVQLKNILEDPTSLLLEV